MNREKHKTKDRTEGLMVLLKGAGGGGYAMLLLVGAPLSAVTAV